MMLLGAFTFSCGLLQIVLKRSNATFFGLHSIFLFRIWLVMVPSVIFENTVYRRQSWLPFSAFRKDAVVVPPNTSSASSVGLFL